MNHATLQSHLIIPVIIARQKVGKKEEYRRRPRAEQRGEMILQIEMIDIVV